MNAEPRAPQQDDDRLPRRTLLVVAAASVAVFAAAVAAAAALASFHPTVGRAADTRRAPDEIGIVEQTLVLDADRGRALRAEQSRALSRFEWIDRDAGIAAIPIERALDLVAADPSRLHEVAP